MLAQQNILSINTNSLGRLLSFIFYSRLAAQSCAGQILKKVPQYYPQEEKCGEGMREHSHAFHPEILRYNEQRRTHSAQCQRRMYSVEEVEYLGSGVILM